MSVAAIAGTGEQRFRISLVSWEKYEQMVAWFDGRHARLTYDRGELELMTVSHAHERWKHLLGALLVIFIEEEGGKYGESPSSRSFPMLAAGEVARFLLMRRTMSELQLLRAFRQWVREQQEQGWPTAPARTPRTKKPGQR